MTTHNAEARPNFFLLLELDPDVPWDHALFEGVLAKKRNQWNRESGGIGKVALDAKANRGYISDIRRVMENDTLRAREAATARRERVSKQQATQQARYTDFKDQLAF